MADDFSLRPARKEDARAMAQLIDIAGEGFATYLWAKSAPGGASPLDVGMRRAEREEGGFSYRNATIAETGGKIAALLLGYRLADPYDTGDPSALPEIVRPLVELESLAPGTWYVNALAAFPEYRNRGLGTRLLAEAEKIARNSHVPAISIIVASENVGAFRLYERTGYVERGRRPLVPFPGLNHGGEWVVLVKPLP